MSAHRREKAALEAIDHGWSGDERSPQDWQTIAIVHGLLAIAEAIEGLVDGTWTK